MELINLILIVQAVALVFNIWTIIRISNRRKIIHRLDYIEPKVTVALRHRFSSVEEFRSWRDWRSEISQSLKSKNK